MTFFYYTDIFEIMSQLESLHAIHNTQIMQEMIYTYSVACFQVMLLAYNYIVLYLLRDALYFRNKL